ncbi:hypothetical protein [Flavobacterium sp.]|uniref:hypothetical protein n=1 Tax=Flavobacterium sp. TaxID=239 RepID=UPI0037520DCB
MKNLIFLLILATFSNAICQERNADEIKPIRDNFKRIDAKKDWKKVDTLNLIDGDSQSIFYYSKNGLEKLIHTNFGESGKSITEYYLLKSKLSFVSEREFRYNYPAMTKEYDPKKTNVEHTKYYFENGNIFDVVSDQDCGSPFASDFVTAENIRLKEEFERIVKLKDDTKK